MREDEEMKEEQHCNPPSQIPIGELLMDPSLAEDCEIDDPELTTTKKHLMGKLSPLSIVKFLQDKHKEYDIQEEVTQFKHPLLNQQCFSATLYLRDTNSMGKCDDINKPDRWQLRSSLRRSSRISPTSDLSTLSPPQEIPWPILSIEIIDIMITMIDD